MTRRPSREAQGVKSLLASLRANGWKCWRIETRQASGTPDIVAADPEGRLVWIECKRVRGRADGPLKMEKLRPAQVAFLARCVRDGVPCAVAVVSGTANQLIYVADLKHLHALAKGSST